MQQVYNTKDAFATFYVKQLHVVIATELFVQRDLSSWAGLILNQTRSRREQPPRGYKSPFIVVMLKLCSIT
ncbi:MAG: hypothetical protein M3278_00225, partial [Thermoproteota archaeon]|nr:hypothetical protein [Thermoproteota archaeon]